MIFVTLGTERFEFNRPIQALDEAAGKETGLQEIFAQTGASRYIPKNFAFTDFLSFEDMVKNINKADIVVAHAGAGSVLLSLNLNKIPVIIPRQSRLREHLDDHQVEFACKMDRLKRSVVAYDEKDLIIKIKNYKKEVTALKTQDSGQALSLACYLREYITNL